MSKAARRQQHHSTDDYVFRPRIVRNEEQDVRRRIKRIYETNASNDQQFRDWIKGNRHVERWLVKRCRELQREGHTRWSMASLFEELRWEESLAVNGKGFRMNNSFRPLMARRLMRLYPDLAGMFEVRTRKPRIRKP